jgi:hypothetical protein
MEPAVDAKDYYLQRASDAQALAMQSDGDRKALYSRLAEQWTMMAESADAILSSLGVLRTKEKQAVSRAALSRS